MSILFTERFNKQKNFFFEQCRDRTIESLLRLVFYYDYLVGKTLNNKDFVALLNNKTHITHTFCFHIKHSNRHKE